MRNAVNCISRDVFTQAARECTTSAYNLLWHPYSEPSLLLIGDETILSATDNQHEWKTPWNPLFFSLAFIQLDNATLLLDIRYLDDARLGGEPGVFFYS